VTVAHDATSLSAIWSTATAQTVSHAGAASGVKGVLIRVVQGGGAGGNQDDLGATPVATYGGQALAEIADVANAGGEQSRVWFFFLGSGVPQGTQTASVTSNGTHSKAYTVTTLTGAADLLVDVVNNLTPGIFANPSLTLDYTDGLASWVAYYAQHTGLAAPVTTVQAGSTHEFGADFGQDGAMWARKSGSAGTSTTMGYTAASDDVNAVGVVIKEGAAGQTKTIAQALETDTATALTRRKLRAVGQAVETGTATAITRQKVRTIGQAVETNTATAFTRRKLRTVAQAVETDTATPFVQKTVRTIAQAVETDTATAFTRQKFRAVGQALETDTAQPITPPAPPGISYVVGGEIEGLSNASVASYSPDQWPSLLAGDVAVLYVATGTTGPPTITVTAPGGAAYDAGTPIDSGTTLRLQRFIRKIASDGEAAPTIAFSINSNSSCAGFSLRGVHPTQIVDVTDTTASSGATATSITLPALSVATNGAWLAVGYASRVAAAPYPNLTAGAGHTERSQRAASSTGSGTTTAAYTRTANPVTTAGNPFDGASFTHDIVGGARQVIVHTALRPAPGGAGQTKAIGQATSTETAQAIVRQKVRAVAQALSAETATALVRQKFRAVAQAISTGIAQPITRRKLRAVGQAVEADTATQIARRKQRTVGQAASTETATAVVGQKRRPVAQALEADTATQLTRRKQRAVAQALEADTATAVGHRKIKQLAQALETDTAQPVTRSGAAKIIAQALETDTATAIARRKQRAVGQATEVDTATQLTRRKIKQLAQALETDTATQLARRKTRTVAQALEADTASQLTRRKVRLVLQALEADTATALVPPGIVRVIGQALEVDIAQAIVVVHTIGRVLEVEGALSVAGAVEGDQMPGAEVSGLSGASEPPSGQGMLALEVSGAQSAGG